MLIEKLSLVEELKVIIGCPEHSESGLCSDLSALKEQCQLHMLMVEAAQAAHKFEMAESIFFDPS